LIKVYAYESTEFQSVLKKQNRNDSLNLIYVEDLIEKYGKFPGNSFVGPSAAGAAYLILQHAPDTIHSKYIDIILDASKNKELSKGSVARYHDRYLVNQGEPQIYGTQVDSKQTIDSITGEVTTEYFIFPIRDTVKIDSLRLWNGLLSLEDYLNLYGLSRWD